MGAGVDSWPRRHWGLVVAVLVLAIANAASSDSGGGEVGQARPPVVAIAEPGDFSVVDASFDVSGFFSGQVDEITVTIDGVSIGSALRGEEEDAWRVPADRVRLADGFHTIVARATGEAGTANARVRVAVAPEEELAIRLDPDRLMFQPGDSSRFAVVETYAAAGGSLRLGFSADVRPPGPTIDIWRLFVDAGEANEIEVDAGGSAPGRYQISVVARSGRGTERAATLVVTVMGPGPPTTLATTTTTTSRPVAPPHTLRYDVVSTVTASSTDLPATDGEATWEITWACPDGRCDATVVDGGPRGGVDFKIVYDAATEAFTFAFTLPQAENRNCPTNDVVGTLTPTEWGPNGPVAFEYSLDSALRCDTGDVTVSWAGEGVRTP